MLGNQITGQGTTAQAARQASQFNRPRERPQVMYMPDLSPPPQLTLPPLLDELRPLIADPGAVWLVGGAVRDGLLRRPSHDLDFVVAGGAIDLARRFANRLDGDFYVLDAERGTARAILTREGRRYVIDVADLRAETLPLDLIERDFTINAMALSMADPPLLLDPTNGQADLRQKLLRATGPAALTGDPVRTIRAVRLATQFGLHIHPESLPLIRAAAPLLAEVSAERVRDEFFKCLTGPQPASALRILLALDILPQIIPEVTDMIGLHQAPPHRHDVWTHTLNVVRRLDDVLGVLGRTHDVNAASAYGLNMVAARLGNFREEIAARLERELTPERSLRGLLMLAALLHDTGKINTRRDHPDGARFPGHETAGAALATERLFALRFSKAEVQWVTTAVQHHFRPLSLGRPDPLDGGAVYRFFRDLGDVGPEVCLLMLADQLATWEMALPPEHWMNLVSRMVDLLHGYFRRHAELVDPPALVDGRVLMQTLGLPPGRKLGQLLEAIREAQASGLVTDREQAITFARQWLKQ